MSSSCVEGRHRACAGSALSPRAAAAPCTPMFLIIQSCDKLLLLWSNPVPVLELQQPRVRGYLTSAWSPDGLLDDPPGICYLAVNLGSPALPLQCLYASLFQTPFTHQG